MTTETPKEIVQLPPPTDGLTEMEDQLLTDLLKKWNGGRISTPVFTELARMIPQPIVEVVIFRLNAGELETLVIPRPSDDIMWPGMVHTPGAAIRRSDFLREDNNPINGPFERIQRGELKSQFVGEPQFIGRIHRMVDRGPEVAEIYIADIDENPEQQTNHIWHPVFQLAHNENFIQSQLNHVLMAAQHYLQTLSRAPELPQNIQTQ